MLCVAALGLMFIDVRKLHVEPIQQGPRQRVAMDALGFGLAGYFMFGLGYIGYMTFVIALLREQGMSADAVTLFYALLGLAVVASLRI